MFEGVDCSFRDRATLTMILLYLCWAYLFCANQASPNSPFTSLWPGLNLLAKAAEILIIYVENRFYVSFITSVPLLLYSAAFAEFDRVNNKIEGNGWDRNRTVPKLLCFGFWTSNFGYIRYCWNNCEAFFEISFHDFLLICLPWLFVFRKVYWTLNVLRSRSYIEVWFKIMIFSRHFP